MTIKMRMTSAAGLFGLRRESSGIVSRISDCRVTHPLRHALTGPDRNETTEVADDAARYLVICELYQRHVGEGTVLDVGCGDGKLYHYLTEHAGMRAACYTGIDICTNAVRVAAARFPEAGFGRRDYSCESVASRFDGVIFSDSLHCFNDPAAILDKCMERNMHACSVLIVALAEGEDKHAALRRLLTLRYRVVDEQSVMDSSGSAWTLLALKLPGSQLGC